MCRTVRTSGEMLSIVNEMLEINATGILSFQGVPVGRAWIFLGVLMSFVLLKDGHDPY